MIPRRRLKPSVTDAQQKSEEVEFDKDEMTKLHAEMCQAMWMQQMA